MMAVAGRQLRLIQDSRYMAKDSIGRDLPAEIETMIREVIEPTKQELLLSLDLSEEQNAWFEQATTKKGWDIGYLHKWGIHYY